MASCRIANCPGEYVERRIVNAVHSQGRIVVIDNVPAHVCNFCGDTFFTADVALALEHMTRTPPAPVETVPLYRFPGEDEDGTLARDEAVFTVGSRLP